MFMFTKQIMLVFVIKECATYKLLIMNDTLSIFDKSAKATKIQIVIMVSFL